MPADTDWRLVSPALQRLLPAPCSLQAKHATAAHLPTHLATPATSPTLQPPNNPMLSVQVRPMGGLCQRLHAYQAVSTACQRASRSLQRAGCACRPCPCACAARHPTRWLPFRAMQVSVKDAATGKERSTYFGGSYSVPAAAGMARDVARLWTQRQRGGAGAGGGPGCCRVPAALTCMQLRAARRF